MAYTYMSKDGYQKLIDEIKKLESQDRPEVIRQIAEAREKGDLSENAEYEYAKEKQGQLEGRIAQLKQTLLNARVLDESNIQTESIQIFTKVTLLNMKTNSEVTYTIVSENESDFSAGKLSVTAPLVKGLLGAKKGQVVDVTVPAGVLTFKVLDIAVGL